MQFEPYWSFPRYRGVRWDGFTYVHWRKEKRRKRKLALLNCWMVRKFGERLAND